MVTMRTLERLFPTKVVSTCIGPYGTSIRSLAEGLGVSPSTVNRIINGQSGVSPAMALRLSKAAGCSTESWLACSISMTCGMQSKILN